MGIEDLQDLSLDGDRVLVISGGQLRNELTAILEKRAYEVTNAENLKGAASLARKELFDIIIFECQDTNKQVDEALNEILGHSSLGRSPVVVLHPNPQSDSGRFSKTSNYQALPLPLSPSELIVTLSKLLRLRKLKVESAGFESRLARQNAELRDLTNRFKTELDEARRIQNSLLPKSVPQDPSLKVAVRYKPLEAVGGDFYDFWQIDDDSFGFLIADVTGHGLPAAFVGAMTKMSLSFARKAEIEKPCELLVEMNQSLADHMPEARFVTAACCVVNTKSGLLQIGRGGHPPVFILRRSVAQVETAEPKGMPVGVFEMAQYEHFETSLEPGDCVLLVTDGIVEASNLDGTMIGIGGVSDMFLESHSQPSVEGMLDFILEKQDAFCDGRIIKDDNTLLGFEWLGSKEND